MSMDSGPRRDVSGGRKGIYYLGMAVSAIGLLMFGSIFVTAAMNFGNFNNFDGQVRSFMFRAIGGMALAMVGRGMMSVGRSGVAGSGIILDPQQARRDLEPFSRAGGGMINDALDEVSVVKEISANLSHIPKEVIKVRCTNCQSLNEEHARFCNQCGREL